MIVAIPGQQTYPDIGQQEPWQMGPGQQMKPVSVSFKATSVVSVFSYEPFSNPENLKYFSGLKIF